MAYVKVKNLNAKLGIFKVQSLGIGCFVLVEVCIQEESNTIPVVPCLLTAYSPT